METFWKDTLHTTVGNSVLVRATGGRIWRSVRPRRTSLIGSGNVTPFALKASSTYTILLRYTSVQKFENY